MTKGLFARLLVISVSISLYWSSFAPIWDINGIIPQHELVNRFKNAGRGLTRRKLKGSHDILMRTSHRLEDDSIESIPDPESGVL